MDEDNESVKTTSTQNAPENFEQDGNSLEAESSATKDWEMPDLSGNITSSSGDPLFKNHSQDFDKNTPFDTLTVQMEERITVMESTLKGIMVRRLEVANERDKNHSNIEENERRVFSLRSKKRDLEINLKRKRNLLLEIELSLKKSRSRLQSLSVPESESPDSMNDMPQTPDSTVDASEDHCNPSHQSNELTQVEENTGVVLPFANFEERLYDFWRSQPLPATSFAPFCPSLDSKAMMVLSLKVATNQIFATDELDNGWQWRRESMWNTCLDARLVLNNAADQQLMTEGDSSAPSSAVSGKEDAFDPHVPLCPYEISGDCQDDFCAYQHTKPRRFGRLLPRELLPLPGNSKLNDHELRLQVQKGPVVNDTSPFDNVEMESIDDSVELNQSDFISLPIVEEDNVGLEVTDEGPKLQVLLSAQCLMDEMASWLAIDQSREMLGSSLFERLVMGCEFYLENESIRTETFNSCDTPEVWASVTHLTNFVRFSIHSGRFDLTKPILNFAVDWTERLKKEKTADAGVASLVGTIVEALVSLEQEAFCYGNGTSTDIFGVAYAVQERLAIVASLLELTASHAHEDGIGASSQCSTWVERIMKGPFVVDVSKGLDCNVAKCFAPMIPFVEEDEQQWFLSVIEITITNCRALRGRAKSSKSLAECVADFLKPATGLFEQYVEASLLSTRKPQQVLLCGAMLIAHLCFGAIEATAMLASADVQVRRMRNDALDILHGIDRILTSMEESCQICPSLQFIFSPVIAASCALGATLHAYDRAEIKLEKYATSSFVLYACSEMFWSQLLQLQASLPKRSESKLSGLEIPAEVAQIHEHLCSRIVGAGSYPHHFSLAHDWNFRSFAIKQPTDDSRIAICKRLYQHLGKQESSLFDFRISNEGFFPLHSRGQSAALCSSLPQSLLMAGHTLKSLVLTGAQLFRLPDEFGFFFPHLQLADLSENLMEFVPESLFCVESLKTLILSNNRLQSLPLTIQLPFLTQFSAENNLLTSIPDGLRACTNLLYLSVSGNELDESVLEVAASLPKLLDLNY